ncbi:hypothetical protein LWM68_09495 [Niabella sp. W65]|nr:hypothetical protein [Niabella sp. W65]MCH7362981.1 hypothetical protein [Niabella sp. W65]
MNKKHSKDLSLLRVTLDGEDLTVSTIFITGDAIALWRAGKERVIDLGCWQWHKSCEGSSPLYIVTGPKMGDKLK